jgi:UDP-2,3-diacylglucosamine pyrophosphatase LpxH
MLVIISDLHLTDGTSGEIIDEKAFRIFRNRISDMAYDASWRRSESASDPTACYYQPIECINILLLGDILDMIRSEKWNDQPEINMPWTKDRGDAFFDMLNEIGNGVLDNNKKSFAILKDISMGGISIPAAMHLLSEEEKISKNIGSQASDEKFHPKVNIYYMIGNHDWFLYIDDKRVNSIRNRVIDELGLVNERDKPFPYTPFENSDLLKVQNEHDVYALHGDVFDATNYQKDTGRDGSSVGDVVVLKLLNEIPIQIEQQIRNFPPDKIGTITDIDTFVKELHEIDNLRPYALAPQWISEVIAKYELDAQFINDSIRGALKQLIHDFTKNPLVAPHHFTVIEMNIAALLLKSHLTIEDLSSVVEFFSLNKDSFESYRQYAKTLTEEQFGKDKSFYIMGHTHYPEIVPLSSFIKEGQQTSKIYMNTGTWRALHKKGIYDDSFISYKTMTIAGFFKGNERMGHSFEYWTGSLDI